MGMRDAGAGNSGYKSFGERQNDTRLFREAIKQRTQDNFETSARNSARSKANHEHNKKSVDHARAVQEQVAAPAAKPKNDLVIGSEQDRDPDRYGKKPGPGKPIKGPEGYPDPDRVGIPTQIPGKDPVWAKKPGPGKPIKGPEGYPDPGVVQGQGLDITHPGHTQETVHIGTQKNHFTSDQPQKDPQAFADKYKLNLINKGMA